MKICRLPIIGTLAAVGLAGALLTGCDTPATVLSGHVTIAASSQPAAGVEVTVYSDTSETEVATTATDADGAYTVSTTELADGTYRLRFGTDTWWNGASSWSSATAVAVAVADPATIDATIASGLIFGTVDGPSGALGDVTVAAINIATEKPAATTRSAVNGTYTLADVPVGSYRVLFTKNGFTSRYSTSAVHVADAPTIAVIDGVASSGIDTTLATESTITGTVVGDGPTQSAIVVALDASDGNRLAITATAANGTFTLAGLNPIPTEISVVKSGYLAQIWGSDDNQLATGTQVTPPAGGNDAIGTITLIGQDCTPAEIATKRLYGDNLVNCDLHSVDLRGATLNSANLTGANLTGADLSNARLTDAVLTNANLTATKFAGAYLTWVSSGGITGAPMSMPTDWEIVGGYVIGPYADLTQADLDGLDLSGAKLSYARLSGASLVSADLTDAWLTSAELNNANLSDATLVSISSAGDLTGANLTNAELTGANLMGSTLTDATVDGTVFTDATFTRITSGGIVGSPATLPENWDLAKGYLIGYGAHLQGANLAGADLSGDNFFQAVLYDADLSGATLTGANFEEANLLRAELTNADLSNAVLSSAFLTNADLTGADLTGAILNGTNVTNADFTSADFTGIASGSLIGMPTALPTGWSIVGGKFVQT